MAISTARLEQLRNEFIPVKNKIDKIDRKYSLDYIEPVLDIPETLGLPYLEYVEKTDEQLRTLADEQTYASYIANVNKLNGSKAASELKIDKQLLALEEKTRIKLANLLADMNKEVDGVTAKITNAGMLFSTVAERVKADIRHNYEANVNETNLQADNERNALEQEREQTEQNYNEALAGLNEQRQAQITAAYNKLLENEREEKIRIDKYNNTVTEKEQKYQMSRAKALESARQAEYDRSFAAKKLYQQMGSVGYEESMLWEKYNVFVSHFANFTKREEALVLIQGDSYVQGHLKQYYSTLIDWVNRNVPA